MSPQSSRSKRVVVASPAVATSSKTRKSKATGTVTAGATKTATQSKRRPQAAVKSTPTAKKSAPTAKAVVSKTPTKATQSTRRPVPKPAAKPVAKSVTKSPAKPAVAKKPSAKKAPAKQAPVKKAPAKQAPKAPKKLVAKTVASKAPATKKAPAKKAPANKAPAQKARQQAGKPTSQKTPLAKPAVQSAPAATVVTKPVAAKPVAAKPVAAKPAGAKRVIDNGFSPLGVPDDLLVALTEHGITSAFPVQELTIPDGLAGRDVCGQAKTGSGKTLAFGIPLVCRTTSPVKPRRPSALVLVPTRELAAQVERELVWLAKPRKLKVVSIYGGVSMEAQKAALNNASEIVVATPGRLIDLLGRGDIELSDVTFLVIDEADRMCDMGFMPNVEWLLRKMPKHRQTLLFSATLGSDVNSLIKHELTNPVRHTVASDTSTVEESVHHFLQVHQMDRAKVVASILRANDRGIVFLNTKRACDRMAEDLKADGIVARAIHGDLSQDQRNRALKQFTEGKIKALVATDVAARGLHIDGVDVVVQADIPDDHKTYLHRAGRTARAGATGVVVTLAYWNQLLDVTRLQKRLGMNTPLAEVFSNDKRLNHLAEWVPGAK